VFSQASLHSPYAIKKGVLDLALNFSQVYPELYKLP